MPSKRKRPPTVPPTTREGRAATVRLASARAQLRANAMAYSTVTDGKQIIAEGRALDRSALFYAIELLEVERALAEYGDDLKTALTILHRYHDALVE